MSTAFIAWGQQVSHYSVINPPENCLAGVELSVALGFDGCEVDVQLTKDGHFVLMHDFTLDRTTNASGRVCDYLLEDLIGVRLRGGVGDHSVCTLTDAMILLRGKGKLMLDVRISGPKAIAALSQSVRDSSFSERDLLILSYDVESARVWKDRFPASLVLLKGHGRVPLEKCLLMAEQWRDGLLLEAVRDLDVIRAIKDIYSGRLAVYLHHRGLDAASLRAVCESGADFVTTQNHQFFHRLR